MLDDKFKALVYSFPSLARREPNTIEDVIRVLSTRPGDGATYAVRFVLSVLDPTYVFFIYDAWGAWDAEHRAAWKAWAADPWWA